MQRPGRTATFRALSFQLNNIVPGKPAPEIEGSDADGKRFRLSDYKGKVSC